VLVNTSNNPNLKEKSDCWCNNITWEDVQHFVPPSKSLGFLSLFRPNTTIHTRGYRLVVLVVVIPGSQTHFQYPWYPSFCTRGRLGAWGPEEVTEKKAGLLGDFRGGGGPSDRFAIYSFPMGRAPPLITPHHSVEYTKHL
jgi:hypothetical protein